MGWFLIAVTMLRFRREDEDEADRADLSRILIMNAANPQASCHQVLSSFALSRNVEEIGFALNMCTI